jgi:UDP-N-acetyl-D-mannosaminuronate dehydrogenase
MIDVKHEYNFDLVSHSSQTSSHSMLNTESLKEYDTILLAVAHSDYKELKLDDKNQMVFGIKLILDQVDRRSDWVL